MKFDKTKEKDIHKILTVLAEAADKALEKEGWKDAKPKTEDKSFGKVTDGGDSEMDAEPKFSDVSKTTGAKKMETKPAFSSIKDPGSNGGATGVQAKGKPKEVKLKESEENDKDVIEENELLAEISRNMRELTTGSPALKESSDDDANSITVDLGFLRDQLFNDTSFPEELIEKVISVVRDSNVENIMSNDDLVVTENRNQRLIKGNPALREDDGFESSDIMESKLSPKHKAKARQVREAIEMLTGKRVVYSKRK